MDVREILKSYSQIDFFKMDVEGAERNIIPAMRDDLNRIEKIFIEYHSETCRPQCLPEILMILKEAGFRVYLHSEFVSRQPYVKCVENTGFDLQIEIFGIRNRVQ